MMLREYDIAIVGGGLVGTSFACCLAQSNLRVAVLEQHPLDTKQQPSYDDRGLALSLSSCRILKAIDVWPYLAKKTVPIRHVHVSDQGKFGFVRLNASDLYLEAMGHVVIARDVGRALLQKLSTLKNVDHLCPVAVTDIKVFDDKVTIKLDGEAKRDTVSCKLLVAADGTNSLIRKKLQISEKIKDYRQTAIVSNITFNKHHEYTAYERFTSQGLIALLPMSGSTFVSIFCIASEEQEKFMNMGVTEYLKEIQDVLGMRQGRVIKIGDRKAYPLKLIRASNQFIDRTVLLGNAAHTVHPNGAQGFNLGLRDAATLAEMLQNHMVRHNKLGDKKLLHDYIQFRMGDQNRVMDFTDTLVSLFCNDNWFKSICRNVGMVVFDSVPPIKNKFTRQAMGIDGNQPGLVRGLRLEQL